MIAKAIVIAALAGTAATAASAQAAAPGKYDATVIVTFVGSPLVHTFDVDADCATGAYTGVGRSTTDLTVQTVSGIIATDRLTGHVVYPSGASWDFNLRPTKTDPTLRGSHKGNKLVGTVVGEKSTDC